MGIERFDVTPTGPTSVRYRASISGVRSATVRAYDLNGKVVGERSHSVGVLLPRAATVEGELLTNVAISKLELVADGDRRVAILGY